MNNEPVEAKSFKQHVQLEEIRFFALVCVGSCLYHFVFLYCTLSQVAMQNRAEMK
ncbi:MULTISPECIES: hypothetical protein [unclassified Methylophaga]|jgi:hypothetical protein|uniref:hypothetical protein n=1 Tax=unclassified Methylophaga TaxID=2629249 RepID=UPI00259D2005|nr:MULTISPECIES: hypothetical protein [unclassified Methylophaga]|tara:strand:- start:11070 stop:11234 length:165 start_codon:yes stop_codon:yes gene_type:complete